MRTAAAKPALRLIRQDCTNFEARSAGGLISRQRRRFPSSPRVRYRSAELSSVLSGAPGGSPTCRTFRRFSTNPLCGPVPTGSTLRSARRPAGIRHLSVRATGGQAGTYEPGLCVRHLSFGQAQAWQRYGCPGARWAATARRSDGRNVSARGNPLSGGRRTVRTERGSRAASPARPGECSATAKLALFDSDFGSRSSYHGSWKARLTPVSTPASPQPRY